MTSSDSSASGYQATLLELLLRLRMAQSQSFVKAPRYRIMVRFAHKGSVVEKRCLGFAKI